jgi:hypothetical protein
MGSGASLFIDQQAGGSPTGALPRVAPLSLKLSDTLAVILAVAAIVLFADTASAETISAAKGAKMIENCKGVTWARGEGVTMGCMNSDGSGVVCGGVTAKQQKTCDTFRVRSSSLGSMVGRGGSRFRRAPGRR